MIEPLTYYRAVCDRCEDDCGGDAHTAWIEAETALEIALASEWKQVGTRLLCWNCWGYGIDGETIVEMAP